MAKSSDTKSGGIAADHLRSFIERIERLDEERAGLSADIREVYSEAKGSGFDVKVMREIVRLRKMDAAARQEREALVDLYKSALGMLADTPLGHAAIESVSSRIKGGTRAERAHKTASAVEHATAQ